MLVGRYRSLHRDQADTHLSAAVPTGAYGRLVSRRIYVLTMTENTWPRDCYSGPGGGLYTGPGGGMYTGPEGGAYTGPEGGAYTGPGGGAYTGPGGGLYTGPGGGAYTGPGEPYMQNWPPIPVLINYMESIGLAELAAQFRHARGL